MSNEEICHKLLVGDSLDGLSLPRINDRVNIVGLKFGPPLHLDSLKVGGVDYCRVEPNRVENVEWRNVDFKSSVFDELRFRGSSITNCTFVKCKLRYCRAWATQFVENKFYSCSFFDSMLGGIMDGRRNQFDKTSFVNCDFRRSMYMSAEFVSCRFCDCRLDKVNFGGSTFVDCEFIGSLNEVTFNKYDIRGEGVTANAMLRVDMSRARLRGMEFRRLDLDTILFPGHPDHQVVDNYGIVLDGLIELFSQAENPRWKKIAAMLRHDQKWMGENQKRGVFSKSDFVEAGGESAWVAAMKVIENSKKNS